MSVAADGSFGVLVVKWRMREDGGEIYVLEQFGDEPGVLYGPIPDKRTAHKFIRSRAGAIWTPFKAARDEIAKTLGVQILEKPVLDRLPADAEA
jgi:hypothetical protein